jgi:hypothetical protein
MKNYYLKNNNKTIFDNTLFEDFSLNLIGKTISIEKERQIIGEKRKKNNKPFIFAYEPTNQKNTIKYIFNNISGNLIKNKTNSKLFNNNIDDISDNNENDIDGNE